jgi:hypothetical protein
MLTISLALAVGAWWMTPGAGALAAGPYYSQATGDFNTLANWNSARNGSGSAPAGFAGNTFVVQNGHTMTLSADVGVSDLTVEAGGTVDVSAFALSVDGALANNGTLMQTQTVDASSGSIEFLHIKDSTGANTKYRGIDIANTSDTSMGAVVVTIKGNQASCNVGDELIHRCYQIEPASNPGDAGAMLTFYFEGGEIAGLGYNGDGNVCDTLYAFRWDSDTHSWGPRLEWDDNYGGDSRICSGEGPAGTAADPYSLMAVGVTEFSPFGLMSSDAETSPNAITLTSLQALAGGPAWPLAAAVVALGGVAAGWLVWRRRKV